jgi:hypothetical protein
MRLGDPLLPVIARVFVEQALPPALHLARSIDR